MPSLYLPASAARRLMQDRNEYTAEVVSGLAMKHEMDRWNRELKQIDDRLELVRAVENTTVPGLRPGYWHILRANEPPTPPSLIVLERPDGGFLEPGAFMFDLLRRADLWHSQVQRDRRRMERELEDAQARAREREARERAEEFADRLKAKVNPGVSMTGQGRGWRYRAGARRS